MRYLGEETPPATIAQIIKSGEPSKTTGISMIMFMAHLLMK